MGVPPPRDLIGGQRLGAGVDGLSDGVGGPTSSLPPPPSSSDVAAAGAARRGLNGYSVHRRGRGGIGSGCGCCGRMASKINKLNFGSGLYKLVGEFGLRENLYYCSIFLCMTLIVLVCFLVINNRGGSDHLGGATAAMYDSGRADN